jgi:hypothetical protein
VARSAPFNPALFDTNPQARLHSLFNQLTSECGHMVREDVQVLLCERTALDWWLYYVWTCERMCVVPSTTISDLVNVWMNSYDHLFYFDDQEFSYVADGFRPAASTLRDEMKPRYYSAFKTLQQTYGNRVSLVTGEIEERVAQVEKEGVVCSLK